MTLLSLFAKRKINLIGIKFNLPDLQSILNNDLTFSIMEKFYRKARLANKGFKV